MDKPTDYKRRIEELHRLEDEGRNEEAASRARYIAEQARTKGDEGYALFFAGEAYCLEGSLRHGAQLQQLAVERLPDNSFMLTSLSVILSIIGQVPEALMHLERALILDSQNIDALGQKGVCLAKIGYKTQALTCFEEILALDPENSYAQRNKAVILSRLGKEKEALDLLNNVLEDNPDDSHAKTEKGILLDEMRLRGTPLGWLFLWVRKTLIPFLHRLRHPRVLDTAP